MIYLYDEDDIFDLYKKNFKDNKNITLDDVKKYFMKPVHIMNSDEKLSKLKIEVRRYREENPKIKLNMLDLYSYLNKMD
jgi:hypothetical protein